MTQEVDVPELPPLLRFVSAAAVGRRIVQAIRWGWRDVFISPEDVVGVGLNTVAPQLVDWAMTRFMGPPRRSEEMSLPRAETPRERFPADAEPPSEPA
jgi:hypothetical protein